MWAGLSCFLSSGEVYFGELLELQLGFEGPFVSSRRLLISLETPHRIWATSRLEGRTSWIFSSCSRSSRLTTWTSETRSVGLMKGQSPCKLLGALSTGNARGTPVSCHHSQSPSDVSVHSRETCFPCTALTFKPRIDSHHGGTWDSPLGKPRGKASRESHRFLDPREGKHDTARDPLPWGVTLVASGKASPHASCSGASRDSSLVNAGA